MPPKRYSQRSRAAVTVPTTVDDEQIYQLLFDNATHRNTFLSSRPDPCAPKRTLCQSAVLRTVDAIESYFFDSDGRERTDEERIERKAKLQKVAPPLAQMLFNAYLDLIDKDSLDRGTLPPRKGLFGRKRKREDSDEDIDGDADYVPDGEELPSSSKRKKKLSPRHIGNLFLHSVTAIEWPRSTALTNDDVNQLFGRPQGTKDERGNEITRYSDISHIQSLSFRNQVVNTFNDALWRQLLAQLPRLETLNFEGCIHVGDEAECFANTSQGFATFVNLSFTKVTSNGLHSLVWQCPNIQTLKLKHVTALLDRAFAYAFSAPRHPPSAPVIPLGNLTHLNVAHLNISSTGLSQILNHCFMTLEKLNISFTNVRELKCLQIFYPGNSTGTKPRGLTKLNISGLSLSSFNSLLNLLHRFPSSSSLQGQMSLQKLKMSRLGLTDGTMSAMIKDLARLEALHSLELGVDNLSMRSDSISRSTWTRLLRTNGLLKRLKKLDLRFQEGVDSRVFKDALEVLAEEEEDGNVDCMMESLWLDGTKIDDVALESFTSFGRLKELRLAKTYITGALHYSRVPSIGLTDAKCCRAESRKNC
ncbi:RNI-like protein [Atractiella rhizophila]|nr:RNI-like protein [Atractiella rhizophila]